MKRTLQFHLAVLAGLVLLLVGLSTSMAAPAPKVKVCHIPPDDPANFHTITISENALQAHLDHGDKFGACGLFSELLCDDGDACTIDAFFEGTESCILPIAARDPTDCDDGDPNTADSCDSVQGCINEPNDVPATCAELQFSGTIWGVAANGLDLRARTNSTLHFIGTIESQTGLFFCQDNPVLETLNFGTSGTLRALVDPGNANGNNMSGGPSVVCCSAANPDAVCNAPDKPADATGLCKALGYASGSVISALANFCPEAEDFSVANDGSDWSSDFAGSPGYGREYTCTGFLPP